MRCVDCHLCISDKGYYDDDFDLICLITNDYVDIEKGCTRTNKWLKQQSKDKWIKLREEQELKQIEDFIAWCKEQDKLKEGDLDNFETSK